MNQVILQVEIDVESLIEECYVFVTSGRRTLAQPHYTSRSIHGTARFGSVGVPRDVLENMIIEGVTDRRHVADFVQSLAAGWAGLADGPPSRVGSPRH